jgi:hypothetical protein
MLAVLGACFVTIVVMGAAATDAPTPAARAPRVVILVLGVGGLLGAAVAWLTPMFGAEATMAPHPGLVATLRTALLVAAVLVLAWAGGSGGFVEGAWVVYPLLILTGLKFLLEDLRAGRPATLFVGFALYGLALIVGPWLCRRRNDATGGQPSGDAEQMGS